MSIKAWLHPECFLASDEVEQPPRATKDSHNYCYRCGVGATNVQPVLRWSIITEPKVIVAVKPTTVEKPAKPLDELTDDEIKKAEIARLKAQLAELDT